MDAHQGGAPGQIAQNEREGGFDVARAVGGHTLESDGFEHPPFGRQLGGDNSSNARNHSMIRLIFHVQNISAALRLREFPD